MIVTGASRGIGRATALASHVLRDVSVGAASVVCAVGDSRKPRLAYYPA